MKSAINWFEIYVDDFDRAKAFYNAILDTPLHDMPFMEEGAMASFAYQPEADGVGGAIVKSPDRKPHSEGALIYLNGGDDLSHILDRVEGAGGKITLPKTSLGSNGYMAIFIDSEGNSIGLHSMG